VAQACAPIVKSIGGGSTIPRRRLVMVWPGSAPRPARVRKPRHSFRSDRKALGSVFCRPIGRLSRGRRKAAGHDEF